MRVLLIGDITGRPGRAIIKDSLPDLIEHEKLDFVIANGENIAGGSGITPDTVEELFSAGVNVVTSGDHIWKQKQVLDVIDKELK